MDKTIKVKVPTYTIIDLMVAINIMIEKNKQRMKNSRNHKQLKENNKNLKKIHRAISSIYPVIIEDGGL